MKLLQKNESQRASVRRRRSSIFLRRSHLNNLLNQDDLSGRFKDDAAKKAQQDARTGYVDYYRNEKGDIQRWAENQTFIALGQMLLAAGIEGLDATLKTFDVS